MSVRELDASDGLSYLQRAIAIAGDARDRGDHPFGAVIVVPGQGIIEATNTVVSAADPTGHAEINALRAAGHLSREVLASATLYASTEPCPMCATGLYWAGLRRFAFALASSRLRELQVREMGENDAFGSLEITSRQLLDRASLPAYVAGPCDVPGALEVHQGYWAGL